MTTHQTDLQNIKRTCKVITMGEKLAIINQLEAGTPRRTVELMFNCSQSTVCRIAAAKDSIRQEAESNTPNKRDNIINYKKLDQALSRWAKEMKKLNAEITVDIVRQKAEELSSAMGHELKPSTTWLYKWKVRENIKFAKRPKDLEDSFQGFLAKREKHKIYGVNECNIKNQNLENESNRTSSSDSECHIKKEHINKFPIIDDSGAIYKSRKGKTFLTLLQKLEILQRLKNGERRADLTAEYKLSQSAMFQIVTDEEKILGLAAEGQNLQMQRVRCGVFKDGVAELNAWVRQKMDIGESLSRTEIKTKAREIGKRLNIDFKASTGWLEKWKARMNMDFDEKQLLQRKVPNYMPTNDDFENMQAQFDQSNSSNEHENCEIKEEQIRNYYSDMESSNDFFYNDAVDVKPEQLTPQKIYLRNMRTDSEVSQTYNDNNIEKYQHEDETDIKTEQIKHNQFCLRDMRFDNEALQTYNDHHTEICQPEDETNIKSEQLTPQQFYLQNLQTNSEMLQYYNNHHTKRYHPEHETDINPFLSTPTYTVQREESVRPTENVYSQIFMWLNRHHIAPTAASELLNILKTHLLLQTSHISHFMQQKRNT